MSCKNLDKAFTFKKREFIWRATKLWTLSN